MEVCCGKTVSVERWSLYRGCPGVHCTNHCREVVIVKRWLLLRGGQLISLDIPQEKHRFGMKI